MIRRLAIAVALAGSASCNSPTEQRPPCEISVQVTATPSAQPEISWNPACGINRLAVTEDVVTLPVTYWSVVSPTSTMYPTVRYGELPEGARESAPAATLPSGSTVLVTAYHQDRRFLGSTKVRIP